MYFFTVVAYRRARILAAPPHVELLRGSFRYVMEAHPFSIDAIVVLPDHLHCIWTLPAGDSDFSMRWRLVKSAFSRAFGHQTEAPPDAGRLRTKERTVWQRRFWEHVIRDETDFERHVDYIHYNPVKHGLVASPKDWPYSSFHRYVRRGVLAEDWGSRSDIELPETVGRE